MNKAFYIKFSGSPYRKGDILTVNEDAKVKVIRFIKSNWIRRMLVRIGFNIKLGHYKVKVMD